MKTVHTTRRAAVRSFFLTLAGLTTGCGMSDGPSEAFAGSSGNAPSPPIPPTAPSPPATPPASPSGGAFALGFDAPTPEQVSFYCPLIRAVATGTRAAVRYKVSGSDNWKTAHPLIYIDPTTSESGGPEPIVPAFAGTIFDLAPGTLYDLEVTVNEPGRAAAVLTGQRATRALPAAAGPATKTAVPGDDLQAKFNALVPGDVLVIASGTYDVSSLVLNTQGTASQPIYVRGASRSGTVIRNMAVPAYTGVITTRNASHVVIEDLTLRSNGVDAGLDGNSFSTGVSLHPGGTSIRPTNLTLRRVTIEGVDRGVVGYLESDGVLIYDCTIRGNNTWDKSWTDNPSHPNTYPNWTWNDDGIRLPGDGHFAFNNTLSGFGDCFANGGSPSDGFRCHATYYARNKILHTGDDAWEADYASRNVAFYDNFVGNSGALFSADPVYGGPSWCFRNISINAWRGPFKWNSVNSGMLVYANTIVKGGNVWRGSGGWLWNQPNNGGASPAKNWAFRNNLFFKSGASPNANILSFDANGSDYYDVDHNGWFGDGVFSWPNQNGVGQSFNSLAAARSGLPAINLFLGTLQRHTGDIVLAADCLDPPLTLGAYTTEYTAMVLPTLRAGTSARNAGAHIAGITDGYSGGAPDIGAVIGGRAATAYGDRIS